VACTRRPTSRARGRAWLTRQGLAHAAGSGSRAAASSRLGPGRAWALACPPAGDGDGARIKTHGPEASANVVRYMSCSRIALRPGTFLLVGDLSPGFLGGEFGMI
jgi:hypothetical protein